MKKAKEGRVRKVIAYILLALLLLASYRVIPFKYHDFTYHENKGDVHEKRITGTVAPASVWVFVRPLTRTDSRYNKNHFGMWDLKGMEGVHVPRMRL